MQIATWGASDVGRTRKVNEDAYILLSDLNLVAVADGMGGFQRGDVASRLACSVIRETVLEHRALVEAYKNDPDESGRKGIKAMLETAIQRACEEVHQAASTIAGEGGRMGCTMDLLMVVGTTAFIAHVGDGRIYLLRGNEAHQLTEDHSLVQQQLREGLISPDEARRARFKNVITRALGVFPSVLVDSLHFELDKGDRLLLCTDGLYRYVGLREVGFTLAGEVTEETVSKLVELANQRGGRDNITVVLCLARVEATGEQVAPTRQRMEVLRRVDLFQYCTYRELMNVCQVAERREVPAGEVLFREGETGRECFVVEAGRVAIEKSGTRLAVAEAGDYFGEMSFIDAPQRSAGCITLEDSTFLVLDRDRFLQLMKQDSELASKLLWQLLHKMSRLVRTTNDKLVAETITLDDFGTTAPEGAAPPEGAA